MYGARILNEAHHFISEIYLLFVTFVRKLKFMENIVIKGDQNAGSSSGSLSPLEAIKKLDPQRGSLSSLEVTKTLDPQGGSLPPLEAIKMLNP